MRTIKMLKAGIVGFGFMGRMHYRCWKGIDGVEVAAICDTNPNIVKGTEKTVGNIEGAEGATDLGGVELYADFDRMLESVKLDAVSITLPTYLHAEYSIKAMAAGAHVLCEKPMSLNVKDCDRMIRAAKRSGKVLQIGHCVRFWPEYAEAKRIVDSGRYGKVIAAIFQRLGAVPRWSIDNWFMDEKRSGGVALDLHIHDTDFVQYLFGMPRAVCSFAAPLSVFDRRQGGTGEMLHIVTQYLYDDGKAVTAEGGWAMTPKFGFEMSFNIMLEKATIVYDLTRQPTFKVYPAEGEPFTPQVEKGDGYSRQTEHFVRIIRGQKVEPVTTLQQSRDSVKIVEAEKKSAKTKRKVAIK
jgi:predicted dehydrogenase